MTIVDDRDGSGGSPELPALPDITGLGSDPAHSGNNVGVKPDFAPDSSPARAAAVAEASAGKASGASDSQEESDSLRGRIFGGFELLAKIGQGGMGVVYKARQVSLDRVVAIKILSKSLSDNSEFIKRFEREAKSIARISHPNIVAVYDFGRADGLYYMVTEFIEGSNLARVINDRLVMSFDELLPIIIHCLSGLAHVSQSGIVHRDIKPDNILIAKDGVAKIADFGLAKDITNDTDLTAVGLAMGTPAYMSPEQCMGRKLDVRSDLYALGVTAYFALTGEKPFTGQSSFEIMTKQREHTPPPPSQLNPRLAKEVSLLVTRMIAKNPHDRFADAQACREAWVELGQRMGLLGGVSRSGEYHFNPSELTKIKSTGGGELPPPLSPVPSPLAPMPPFAAGHSGAQPAAPPPVISSVDFAPLPVADDPIRSSGRGTDRADRRPTTERRSANSRGSGEAVTCTRCGMLNRGDLRACQRCQTPLHGEDEPDAKEQEVEAQQRFERGEYKSAAELFARLADKSEDRKARSILRSREREARKLEQEHQLGDLHTRSSSLIERGDIRAGIDVLERGLREVRDVGASGADAEGQLMGQIAALRGRLRRGRQMRVIAVVVVLLALCAAGAWWAWRSGRLDSLLGVQPRAVAPAAESGMATP